MQAGLQLLGARRITAIDFEGTPASGVVEYGVASILAGGAVECATGFCAPCGAWTPRDAALTGIRQATLKHAAPFEDQWERLRVCREEGPLLAHHAAVEDRLLRKHFPVPGTVPDWSGRGPTVVTWGPWLDTLRIWGRIWPEAGRHDLASLVELLGLDRKLAEVARAYCPSRRRRWHCALYDALACLLLWEAALVRLPEESGAGWFHRSRAGEADDRFQQGELF